MRYVQKKREENTHELALYRHAPQFVPAGQSTQMIIGATPESDYQIIRVAESLYQKFELKRVFYSAFVHVNEDSLSRRKLQINTHSVRKKSRHPNQILGCTRYCLYMNITLKPVL